MSNPNDVVRVYGYPDWISPALIKNEKIRIGSKVMILTLAFRYFLNDFMQVILNLIVSKIALSE